MAEAKWENLKENKCPYCGSGLDINPICGRRKCLHKGCGFKMSKQTVENLTKVVK